jgi:hypothetical protein
MLSARPFGQLLAHRCDCNKFRTSQSNPRERALAHDLLPRGGPGCRKVFPLRGPAEIRATRGAAITPGGVDFLASRARSDHAGQYILKITITFYSLNDNTDGVTKKLIDNVIECDKTKQLSGESHLVNVLSL